jgi:hypothetical protein
MANDLPLCSGMRTAACPGQACHAVGVEQRAARTEGTQHLGVDYRHGWLHGGTYFSIDILKLVMFCFQFRRSVVTSPVSSKLCVDVS